MRTTQFDPPSDSIDTSPVSSNLPRSQDQQRFLPDEIIEIEAQSSSVLIDEPEKEREDARPVKRRRMSISPVVDAMPDQEECHEPMALDDEPVEFDDISLSEDHETAMSSFGRRIASEDPPPPTEPSTRHPTFLSAPRFKPNEAVERAPDRTPLPEAFSPRRRGAKYATGGLAAEVRDWLVQVRGASEYDRPTGESVRLIVNQVRHSPHGGMCMVSGSEVEGGTEVSRVSCQTGDGEGKPARVVLAGDGRIAGLGGKNSVTQGEMVSMYQPMWDLALKDLGRFAVACDWEKLGQAS